MYQTFTKTAKKARSLSRILLFFACMVITGVSSAQVCTPTINNHCCNMGSAKVEIDNGSVLTKSTTWSQSTSYWNYYNTVSGCVASGSTYTLDVTVGPSYNYAVCVWVDWDKDDIFDPSEKVDSAKNVNPNAVVSMSLVVPSGLSAGGYRMLRPGGCTGSPAFRRIRYRPETLAVPAFRPPSRSNARRKSVSQPSRVNA